MLGAGSQTFTAPAAAPAIDLSKVAAPDAARFLAQATFGATSADIATVTSQGYAAWIANQMAVTPTSHLDGHPRRRGRVSQHRATPDHQ